MGIYRAMKNWLMHIIFLVAAAWLSSCASSKTEPLKQKKTYVVASVDEDQNADKLSEETERGRSSSRINTEDLEREGVSYDDEDETEAEYVTGQEKSDNEEKQTLDGESDEILLETPEPNETPFETESETPPDDETTSPSLPINFTADIKPLAVKLCVSCHSSQGTDTEAYWLNLKGELVYRVNALNNTVATYMPRPGSAEFNAITPQESALLLEYVNSL
jgi:hypothetical protein